MMMVKHNFPSDFVRIGWRQLIAFLLIGFFVFLMIYVNGQGTSTNLRLKVHLVVYAYSTQEDILTQAMFPAFEQKWETESNRDLEIEGVFGPSRTIAEQINLGSPADIAIFSNEHHVMLLKVGHKIAMDAQSVVIGSSPIVIVIRPGNPAQIEDFSDLAQNGLFLLHANPLSSGVGEWAILAEYGSALLNTGNQIQAEQQVEAIWKNVRLMAPSARAAMNLFELGSGDALVTYEQDAVFAMARGIPVEIVMPPRTIITQPVAVIVDENITLFERNAAEAFLQFLQSDSAQEIYRLYYQRSPHHELESFSEPVQLFTVDDLGGWFDAYDGVILPLWQKRIEPGLDL